MIIVKIKGGLGNQLFQYAVGFALARKHNTTLRTIDLTGKMGIARNYWLDHFNTSGKKINSFENFWYRAQNKVATKLGLAKYKYTYYLQHDEDTSIQEVVFKFGANTMLDGFYQNEIYFKDVADDLRNELTLKDPLSDYSKELLSKIQAASNPVFIHVRRGDYVQNETTNQVHGTCDAAYYNSAIAYIKQNIENPTFFIFSDEPEWAKENIQTGSENEVSFNDAAKTTEDITLMSNCKHAIIANSTFSWWGAWLIKDPEKIICAPKLWWASKTEADTDLVVPKDWKKF